MSGAILLLAISLGAAGCAGSRASSAPVAPSPLPQPAPRSNNVEVTGWVYDTAFRSLAGTSVEVLDGPQAGASTITDAEGRFSLTGTFDDATRFRAIRAGHAAGTGTFSPTCATCSTTRRFMFFYLATLEPPVDIAGDYTLTFIADSACTDIPSHLRTRTFTATIAPGSNSHSPPNTFFNATVSGATFLEHYGSFPVGVAGNLVAFDLRGEGPYLVEEVAPNTYVGFDGRSEATMGPGGASTISTSFQGRIDYCALRAPMGQYYSCPPGLASARVECESIHHQLILTRR
jgi:hypothetical protein